MSWIHLILTLAFVICFDIQYVFKLSQGQLMNWQMSLSKSGKYVTEKQEKS